ncbi:lipopolysaccharide core heptose(I) kinase RfaP [Alcanivorax nanhaiticus]|uniref:Lipopolysaccharide core heptose(I) kinase n=1 Tax=Alcanivorax nanhaiticus TaxID=1177154 RepID=A0A095SIJ2_9GAMM|nr:lipopolysaccharide core heptose(I) kinase RfaP [Alcanivorax nanhaiticus]KGD64402.1 lipopolysaccharide core heptose(I) kinase RfaP [Alcanivorax nanhaiticus]
MTEIFLRDEFASAWHDRDPFECVDALEGEVFRAREGRRTLRFAMGGKSFFLKYHRGVGWKEVLKNLIQLRLPIISALSEVRAIEAVAAAGLDTMTIAGYGQKGINPARIHSFLITDDLANTLSLEDAGLIWEKTPPDPVFKRALMANVVRVARSMHEAGINHRDFYLCHFLMDLARWDIQDGDAPLYLIDLHRAQVRGEVPWRWLVKDVSGLFYSAMDIGLTARDVLRCMALYSGKSWRETLREDKRFWLAVRERAEKLYRKDKQREAPRWI